MFELALDAGREAARVRASLGLRQAKACPTKELPSAQRHHLCDLNHNLAVWQGYGLFRWFIEASGGERCPRWVLMLFQSTAAKTEMIPKPLAGTLRLMPTRSML